MATPKGAQRRAELVEAAARIVVAEGWAALSHRAVAALAGVPLGATTYYFANLGALRQAAIDELVAADVARMKRVCGALSTRRRGARRTAELVVEVLTPADHDEMIAWYERYVQGARDPLLATAARNINAAAREYIDAALDRCGFGGVVPASVVLAVVDGAVVGSLAERADVAAVRSTTSATLAIVLAAAQATE